MARSSSDPEELREELEEGRGQEEEEALSLCDLPVKAMKDEEEEDEKQPLVAKSSYQQEEFEFGPGGSGSISVRSEMCAAEDVFYRGQILPLRHSFSSSYEKVNNKIPSCFQPIGLNFGQSMSRSKSMDHDLQTPDWTCGRVIVNCGINWDGVYPAVNKNPSSVQPVGSNYGGQSVSRSESMDRVLPNGFNSFSNRSSSTSSRSIAKNSSVSSVNTGSDIAAATRIPNSKPPKEVNQFRISHPSPKPQMVIRHSNSPGTQFPRSSRNKSNSSMWDFFKLGLVRTPELQDLNKVRAGAGSVSRNSSSGSSSFSTGNSNSTSKGVKISTVGSKEGRKPLGFFERKGGAMLSGCSCTVSAVVKPIPLNHTNNRDDEDPKKVTLTKRKNNNKHRKKVKKKETSTVEKLKQKKEEEEREGMGKREMSRHRTFEWIKELSQSHASYVHDKSNNIREEEEAVVIAS